MVWIAWDAPAFPFPPISQSSAESGSVDRLDAIFVDIEISD